MQCREQAQEMLWCRGKSCPWNDLTRKSSSYKRCKAAELTGPWSSSWVPAPPSALLLAITGPHTPWAPAPTLLLAVTGLHGKINTFPKWASSLAFDLLFFPKETKTADILTGGEEPVEALLAGLQSRWTATYTCPGRRGTQSKAQGPGHGILPGGSGLKLLHMTCPILWG